MQEITDQLETDDKAFVMSQPLEVFMGASEAAEAAAETVPDGSVAAVTRKRAQRAVKRGRKAKTAATPKAAKAKKKAPPGPRKTAAPKAANGKANGHAKGTVASSADALVTGYVAKLGKGAEFKMGDLIKASGDKISRVTLINSLAKLGKQVTRQGSGRGTSYVVA